MSAAVPAFARPWDIVRASLPEGWGMELLTSSGSATEHAISGCAVFRVDRDGERLDGDLDGYTIMFAPVTMSLEGAKDRPDWLVAMMRVRRAKWYSRHVGRPNPQPWDL